LSKPVATQEAASEAAFGHFFTHRAMLRAYLRAFIRDSDVVDDVLSDVAVAVARSWDNFDRSLPFGPWVRGVARRVALKRLAQRQRAEVILPDDVLESLGAVMDELPDQDGRVEEQRERLKRCLEQLTQRNRELVQLRYSDELKVEAIAARVRRSVGALYTAFSRIHAALLRCMEQGHEGIS
jgi:RNA polymerase sigma-70 factor, ECF subfamily